MPVEGVQPGGVPEGKCPLKDIMEHISALGPGFAPHTATLRVVVADFNAKAAGNKLGLKDVAQLSTLLRAVICEACLRLGTRVNGLPRLAETRISELWEVAGGRPLLGDDEILTVVER